MFRLSTERYELIVIMLLVEVEFLVVLWSFLVFVTFVFFYLCVVCVCTRMCFHLFSPQRVPIKISCRAGLVVTNSFSFCLSGKLFISLSILNDSLAG